MLASSAARSGLALRQALVGAASANATTLRTRAALQSLTASRRAFSSASVPPTSNPPPVTGAKPTVQPPPAPPSATAPPKPGSTPPTAAATVPPPPSAAALLKSSPTQPAAATTAPPQPQPQPSRPMPPLGSAAPQPTAAAPAAAAKAATPITPAPTPTLSVVPGGKAYAAPVAQPRILSESPPKAPPKPRSSLWPWALTTLVIGGGMLGYFVLSDPEVMARIEQMQKQQQQPQEKPKTPNQVQALKKDEAKPSAPTAPTAAAKAAPAAVASAPAVAPAASPVNQPPQAVSAPAKAGAAPAATPAAAAAPTKPAAVTSAPVPSSAAASAPAAAAPGAHSTHPAFHPTEAEAAAMADARRLIGDVGVLRARLVTSIADGNSEETAALLGSLDAAQRGLLSAANKLVVEGERDKHAHAAALENELQRLFQAELSSALAAERESHAALREHLLRVQRDHLEQNFHEERELRTAEVAAVLARLNAVNEGMRTKSDAEALKDTAQRFAIALKAFEDRATQPAQPLRRELHAVLAVVGADPVLSALFTFGVSGEAAEHGVLSELQLEAAFAKLDSEWRELALTPSPDSGVGRALLTKITALLRVQESHLVAGDDDASRLSRAHVYLLKRRDVASAVREVAALRQPQLQQATADWLAAARSRVLLQQTLTAARARLAAITLSAADSP